MNTAPTIVVTEGLEKIPFAWLRENANVIEASWKDPPSSGPHLQNADGLIVRTYTQVNPALLAHAPKLKVVGRAGVGLENIDIRSVNPAAPASLYRPPPPGIPGRSANTCST